MSTSKERLKELRAEWKECLREEMMLAAQADKFHDPNPSTYYDLEQTLRRTSLALGREESEHFPVLSDDAVQ